LNQEDGGFCLKVPDNHHASVNSAAVLPEKANLDLKKETNKKGAGYGPFFIGQQSTLTSLF